LIKSITSGAFSEIGRLNSASHSLFYCFVFVAYRFWLVAIIAAISLDWPLDYHCRYRPRLACRNRFRRLESIPLPSTGYPNSYSYLAMGRARSIPSGKQQT